MVKVATLVADTIWSPGSAYHDTAPELSILLPTFRRGADGLLQKVLERIASQTFRDFELIIVDDASTDGSVAIIRDWMARDGRISSLTHPNNIGLPAVSELEAYLKSRGRFIGFAFDDFIYEPNAFEALVSAARANPEALIHGYAEMMGWGGPHRILGRSAVPYARLSQNNFIANATVLMPRQIVETVGFYDPHILAARNCDWDLWRRVQRHFPIIAIPAFIGRELGNARPDSLGRTYPVFQEIMSEFYGGRSNQALLPTTLPDRDIWAIPERSSSALAAATLSIRRFFKHKAWAAFQAMEDTAELRCLVQPRRPIIGVAGYLEATIPLCFDGLQERFGGSIKIIDLGAAEHVLAQQILLCDAVIISRWLFEPAAERAIRLCEDAGIDLYYLADDNPIVLAREHPEYSQYSLAGVKSALQGFRAVMATSPALADYYKANGLHQNLQMFGPILDRATLGKMHRIGRERRQSGLRVGFAGGEFRHHDLQLSVYPALQKLSERMAVELVARETSGAKGTALPAPPPPIAWRPVPFSLSYDDFLQNWRALGIDVLVHPRGTTANIAYKTNSILLTAFYLGAVPIVSDEPAFDGIGEMEGVLKASVGPDGFTAALERVLAPAYRDEMLRRLEMFCVARFDLAPNERVIEAISDATRPIDLIDYHARLSRECARMSDPANVAKIHSKSRAFVLALKIQRVANFARRAKAMLLRRP